MDEQIAWCVELEVKAGRLDSFRELTGEMVEATRGEPGVLAYQRFIAADDKTVHVYERYADSAAAVAHLNVFEQKFGHRFSSLVDRVRFAVYGSPSSELKRLLDRFGAVYLEKFAGLDSVRTNSAAVIPV
jgi:quinol monooxygenase YgiN